MAVPTRHRATIVVIDDDDPFLSMMRDILEGEDYTVAVGSVVGDARALFLAHDPALVIIDLVMQTQEAGLDVLRDMRTHPDTENAGADPDREQAICEGSRRRDTSIGCCGNGKTLELDELLSRVADLIFIFA